MDHNAEKNNKVYLMGEIVSEAVFSHEVYGKDFTNFTSKSCAFPGRRISCP